MHCSNSSQIHAETEPKLLPISPKTLPVPYKADQVDEQVVGEGYRVLLFNDEVHSLEEVVLQLMRALQCPPLQAEAIALRAHHNGQAVVTITYRDEAERIASILREIALQVSVDPV